MNRRRRLALFIELLLFAIGILVSITTGYLTNSEKQPAILRPLRNSSILATIILGFIAIVLFTIRSRHVDNGIRPSTRNPYPGLEPLTDNHSDVFFGRAAEVRDVVARLSEHASVESRIVTIVGPSGVGKSSLILAGVLPDLRHLGGKWLTVQPIVPGPNPAERLRSTVREAVDILVRDQLEGRGRLRRLLIRGRIRVLSKRVAIVVDQAEELFTLSGVRDREDFLTLLEASLQTYTELTVILTIRAEFFAPLLETRWSHYFLHPIAIGVLGNSALLDVVQGPATVAGIRFDPPDLPIRIVDDVDSGLALPLLAYALQELYLASQPARIITAVSYESLGGVKGVIAREADRTSQLLIASDSAAPIMPAMLKLVTLSEDHPTRRRAGWDEFPVDEQRVIQAFIDSRLVVSDIDELVGTKRIQVAHEALFQYWTPIAQEIETRKSQLRWRADLERWAQEWHASNRNPSYLLTGSRLRAAEQWIGQLHDSGGAPASVARFLEHSRWADTDTMNALSIGVSRLSIAELEKNPEYSLRLAVAALRECGTTSDARRALAAALQASKVRRVISTGGSPIWGLSWSPDGALLASGGADGAIHVSRPDTGESLAVMLGHRKGIRGLAWSPNGRLIASAADDQTVKIWDTRSYQEIATLHGHSAGIRAVSWSADGRSIASASDDRTARIWRSDDFEEIALLSGHTSGVRDVDWSPDGRLLATASDDCTIRLWDTHRHVLLRTLTGHRSVVWSVAFSPDGLRLASTSEDKAARLWDPISGNETGQLQGHAEGIWRVKWDPTGQLLATASYDRSIRVWEASTLRTVLVLRGHDKWVRSLAWSPTLDLIASGSEDETVRIWDVSDAAGANVLRGHEDGVWSVCWSPDGRRIATASYDQTVRLWEFPGMRETQILRGHSSGARAVSWSPVGDLIASGGLDGQVIIWDVSLRMRVAVLTGHQDGVWSVGWSPDGRRIASASYDHTVRVWDSATHHELLVLRGHEDGVRSVSWSSDGRYLASTSYDKTVRIWAGDGGAAVQVLEHASGTRAAIWKQTGYQLATTADDGSVQIWDGLHGTLEVTFPGHEDGARSASWSPDGSKLVSSSYDHTLRVWTIEHPEDEVILGVVPGRCDSVAWAPNDRWILATSDDGLIRLWDGSETTNSMLRVAASRVLGPLDQPTLHKLGLRTDDDVPPAS